jgi:GPI mannosyltransferase 2
MGIRTRMALANTDSCALYISLLYFRAHSDLQPYLPTLLEPTQLTLLTSIVLSNLFHLFALFPLYSLCRQLFPLNRPLAITTCILHSFSPAGAFLLAGNTETLFCFLSFAGMALFHKGCRILPAIFWSLAGTVRSNAILWTGFYAWDGLNVIFSDDRTVLRKLGRLTYLGICAIISIGGFAWWQYSAWEQYCLSDSREWCSYPIPLIYYYVQNKYWYLTELSFLTSGTSDSSVTGQQVNSPTF